MRSDSDLHETRTNAEHSGTASKFRVNYESLARTIKGQGAHLYFIKVVKGRGPVKIGRANDPSVRLPALQVACPYQLKLLGVLEGFGDYELAFHLYLARDRMRGEWFGWSKRVEETVKLALTGGDWRAKITERERIAAYDDWRIGSPLYQPREARDVRA